MLRHYINGEVLKSRRYINHCHDKDHCTVGQTHSKWPDTNISRQVFGFHIWGCARNFVHQLPWERKNHQQHILYSINGAFKGRNQKTVTNEEDNKCSFTKTMHRVTSWSQWWQNYMNCTSNCFWTHTILQVGWLVGFYGLSTFVGYLMPNSVYMYIHSTKDFFSNS